MSTQVHIVTNNEMVHTRYHSTFSVLFCETDYLGILFAVRDRIHNGCRLLTHPMAGSLKPNQTPYKSILLHTSDSRVEYHSLALIEQCIERAHTFLKHKSTPVWSEAIRNDFRTVDLSLIEGVITNHHELPKRRYAP